MHELELFLIDEILQKVPHRHVVFCIPKALRHIFLRNRKSLNDLSRIAWNSIKHFSEKTLNRRNCIPGGVLVIQTHGNLVNPHPHIHAIVADGLFSETGTFYRMPRYRREAKACLQKLFEKEVITFCLKNSFIRPENARRILSQRYTGFSVYVDTEIRYSQTADDKEKEKMKQMLRYISKSFYSIERTIYKNDTKIVLYKGQYHPGFKRNFQIYSPTDFIAAVTAHIPNRYQKYTNYYGRYSSRTRGRIRKEHQQEKTARVTDTVEPDQEQKKFRRNWAILIQKVYEIDPLICPKCQGKMRVISVIEEDAVIEKILRHRGEWADNTRAPPTIDYAGDEIISEPFDDGWRLAEPGGMYNAA